MKLIKNLLYILIIAAHLSSAEAVIALGNINYQDSYERKEAILESRQRIESASTYSKDYYKERLFQIYRRAVEANKADKKLMHAFVEDDLKYGDGQYAVHLLQYMGDEKSNLRLMEINLDKKFIGKSIAIRPFLYSPVKNRDMILSGKNIYNFGPENAREIFPKIDKTKLSFSSLIKLGDLSNQIFKKGKPEELEVTADRKGLQKKTLQEKISPAKPLKPEQSVKPAVSQKRPNKSVKTDLLLPEEKKSVSDTKVDSTEDRASEIRQAKHEIVDSRYFWEVTKVKGFVRSKRKETGLWENLAKGSKIYEGDILKTGNNSSVILKISGLENDSSFSQLFANSELEVIKLSADNLNDLDDVYLDLILGEVLVNIEDIPVDAGFAVNTPTAVAGVRGTLFGVKVHNTLNSEVTLLRGTLNVQQRSARGTRDIILYPGEKLVNDYFKILPVQNIPLEKKESLMQQAAENIEELEKEFKQRRKSEEKHEKDGEEEQQDEALDDPGEGGDGQDKQDSALGSSESDDLVEKSLEVVVENEPLAAEEDDSDLIAAELNTPGSDISEFADPSSPMNPSYDPTLDAGNYEDGEYTGPGDSPSSSSDSIVTVPTIVSTSSGSADSSDETSSSGTTTTPAATVIYVDSISGSDANDGTAMAAPLKTLTAAISKANSIGTKFISLAQNGVTGAYNTTNGEIFPIALYDGVDISSHAGADTDVILEGGSSTMFTVSGGIEVFFENLLINGDTVSTVAFTCDGSTLNLANVEINNCDSGIILNNNSHLRMDSGHIMFCNVEAIIVNYGSLDLSNVVFSENSSPAIYNPPGSTPVSGIVNNCEFSVGSAQVAIQGDASGQTLTFTNCSFFNNTTSPDVVNCSSGPNMVLIFENCSFFNNSTTGNIIYKYSSPSLGGGLDVNRCWFYSNIVPNIIQGSLTNTRVFNSLFYNNDGNSVVHVDNIGDGSTAVDGSETVQIIHNTFDQNIAVTGVIEISGLDDAAIKNNAFSNTTSYYITGGGLLDFDNNFFDNAGSTLVAGQADLASVNAGADCSGNVTGPSAFKDPYPAATVNYMPDSVGPSGLINIGADLSVIYGSGHLATDLFGSPRSVGLPDAGCIENQGSDPLFHGMVVDSLSGTPVENAVVSIYRPNSSTPLKVSSGSTFAFDMDPGSYFINVSGTGLSFPSSRANSVNTGDHGEVFTIIDGVDMNFNIPVDVTPSLIIEKSSNKSYITPGGIITMGLEITNPYRQQSISDINIIDTIPKGFKYIPGSIRYNNSIMTDPIISSRALFFPAGSLNAGESQRFTYQLAASTGAFPGEYQTYALARNSANVQISNRAEKTVLIEEETLFSSATVLGRVFADANNNGYFDIGEETFSDVELALENGLIVTSGEEGFFHLKDIHYQGRHVLKVISDSLPKGYKSAYKHGKLFEVTKGSIINIPVPLIKGYDSSDFFFIGLGEISATDYKLSGALDLLDEQDEFNDGFHVEGRGAFYLRGKIRGKYLIEASYDSERSEDSYAARRASCFLTNLDPDKYYPVYGDSSKRDYSALETKDDFFVLISWQDMLGEWQAKWGSIEIDWPVYRKIMQGARLSLTSKTKNADDIPNYQGEIFYGKNDYLSAHEEYIGTGMSVYRLKNKRVIEGSEKVRVVMKNSLSELNIHERLLVEEIDYVINYDSGIITLKRPLSAGTAGSGDSIVSNNVLTGLKTLLVVDYDYENLDITDKAATGFNISKAINEKVNLTLSYAEEDRDEDPYKIADLSARWKINQQTNLNANISYSEETFSEGGTSYDGGFSFSGSNQNSKADLDGISWNLNGKTTLFNDKLNLEGSYSETEPGFSAREHFSSADAKSTNLKAEYKPLKALAMGVDYHKSETETTDPVAASRAVVDYLERTIFYSSLNSEKWELKGEYVVQQSGLPYTGELYLGALPPAAEELAAVKASFMPVPGYSYYAIWQTTIESGSSSLDNDMNTVGMILPLFNKADLSLEGRSGDIGDSLRVGFNIRESNEEESFIGFETGTHAENGKFESVSFSKNYLNEDGSQYRFLKDYSYFNARVMEGDLFSLDVPLKDWTLGFSLENAYVEERSGLNSVSRDSASFRYNYHHVDYLRFLGKVEWRIDKYNSDGSEREFIYLEDQLHMKISMNTEIFLKAFYETAKDDTLSDKLVDYKKLTAGFSIRPYEGGRTNLLGKIDIVDNIPLAEREDFFEETISEKYVFSLLGEYKIFHQFGLTGKVAWRKMREKSGERDYIDSDTYLAIMGINYDLFRNLSLGIEYRILENIDFEDSKNGYLIKSIFGLSEWLDLVWGYNFTDFDDDLSNSDSYEVKGWFLRLSGHY